MIATGRQAAQSMRLALRPGLTFAPVRMYQFFRLGSFIYQGCHFITEFISDIGQCVILIFYNIMQQSCDNHVLGGIILRIEEWVRRKLKVKSSVGCIR